MNTNRGIFETIPNQSADPKSSPFAVAKDEAHGNSPFAMVNDAAIPKVGGSEKPVKLPERKRPDSPFQMAEPSEGFGFGTPSYPQLTSPTGSEKASPFSVAPQFPSPLSQPFGAATPAPAASASDPGDYMSEASSIRQLELRAIFGADREMSAEEILQKAASLKGIRSLKRVGTQEMATIEGLKNLLPALGITGGPLRIHVGSTMVEFIRSGPVVLAVQTDVGFAPGVRETLMIVARELGRL